MSATKHKVSYVVDGPLIPHILERSGVASLKELRGKKIITGKRDISNPPQDRIWTTPVIYEEATIIKAKQSKLFMTTEEMLCLTLSDGRKFLLYQGHFGVLKLAQRPKFTTWISNIFSSSSPSKRPNFYIISLSINEKEVGIGC